ncbi:uncharacterized protein LOC133662864 [Entelurus aequoreus]|uniref:uncharacterized protein LOC133662864 n=1 Tax=Entelurus aequoreus TaxID=161455 RepID=UPI002B1DF6A9|nr:uncharacterized protein LOC133662864 [Entelurus aequoreus]
MSPSWPGNASGSPKKSWTKWLGRGKSGLLCLGCCPRNPTSDKRKKMDGFSMKVMRKGKRNDRVIFTVSVEDIPLIVDQPIRSLGRLYIPGLSDKDMGKIILQQLSEGLSKSDAGQLPWVLLPVPKDDVASEAVRSHVISRKPDGSKSQLFHLKMAWPATVLLSCWPVWMELTPAAPEIYNTGLQAGEGKAADGAKGLLRQGSGGCKCQSRDWKEVEGQGGGPEGDVETATSRSRGHGPDRLGRPWMERSTHPMV